MPENWERGDLALCVAGDGAWNNGIEDKPGPVTGQCYTVDGVMYGADIGLEGLRFDAFGDWYYISSYFIKVTPPKDMVLDEEETLIPA